MRNKSIFSEKHIDSRRGYAEIIAMQRILPVLIAVILFSSGYYFISQKKQQFQHASEVPPAKTEVVQAPASTPTTAEASATDVIPADPKAVYGKLDNGMKYIILPNHEPPSRFSVRLHIQAGSLMEAEDQRGLAHFLEHMMFNGSKHFAADELVPKMQRLGIGFGAHVNAYTSFDETVYMLDLPDQKDDTVNLAYTVMRDFADGALLKSDEIEKERGVILAEKTSRDSVQFRMMEKQFKELLPLSLIPNRFPIGEEKVIQSAPQNRFQDFYNRYYTPERMTFIAVGDFDVAEMQKKIEATFSTMKASAHGDEPNLGEIKQPKGITPNVFTDAELTSTDLSLLFVKKFTKKPDTVSTREEKMPLAIANAMLDRRFERIAKAKDTSIVSGSANRQVFFNEAEIGSIDVSAKDDNWQRALPVVEQELRRAMDFGFTEAEFAEVRANTINAYEQEVKAAASRKSETLASGIASSINDGTVFSTPETDLEIAKSAIAKLNAETCHKAFKEFWKQDGFHLILTAKNAPSDAKEKLLELFQSSQKSEIKAPEKQAAASFAYTDFGKAGTVVERHEVDDFKITQLTLSNGIKVNLKPTDFQKNSIQVKAVFGGGQLTSPADKPGLMIFANAIFNAGGLGKHDAETLQQILAGKNVSALLGIDEDHFALGGSTTPDDFLLELQLLCASLTDPGYHDDAIRQFRSSLPMLDASLKHSEQGPQMQIEAWLHGGDHRYTMPPVNVLEKYEAKDVKDWLTPELSSAPLELSIVGDFKVDEVLDAICKTFGALPARTLDVAKISASRTVKKPAVPSRKDTSFISKVPQGIVTVSWQTDTIRKNQPYTRRLNVVGSIVTDRLREELREKLGASYSPHSAVTGSDALDDFGYLAAMSVCKPGDMNKVEQAIVTMGQKLADEGATADELERAKKPMIATIEKTLRDNGYWLNTVMARCQQDPAMLDLARSRAKDYASISLDEVNAIAKKILHENHSLITTIVSEVK